MNSRTPTISPFTQPKAVWAVTLACVISFMGIGLVGPILPTIARELDATPSQVGLMFTSYMVVTAVLMLITGWISSRIGTKQTLIVGLALIVVFAALAGTSSTINEVIGFRAGWGLGNALFIATSLAVIVNSAVGGAAGAVVLYETALGVGVAAGPIVGGLLGGIGWRWPFFGVSITMAVSLLATVVLLPSSPAPQRKEKLSEPVKALRHRRLAMISIAGLLSNWGFLTVIGYSPFVMGPITPWQLGLVFCGWGALVAIFAIWVAPRLRSRFGTAKSLYYNLALLAVNMVIIALWSHNSTVVIAAVISSGAQVGVNNLLMTTAVMGTASVDGSVSSAIYGFVRFIGGGLAPFVAGYLAAHINTQAPFSLAAGMFVAAIFVVQTVRRELSRTDQSDGPLAPSSEGQSRHDSQLLPIPTLPDPR